MERHGGSGDSLPRLGLSRLDDAGLPFAPVLGSALPASPIRDECNRAPRASSTDRLFECNERARPIRASAGPRPGCEMRSSAYPPRDSGRGRAVSARSGLPHSIGSKIRVPRGGSSEPDDVPLPVNARGPEWPRCQEPAGIKATCEPIPSVATNRVDVDTWAVRRSMSRNGPAVFTRRGNSQRSWSPIRNGIQGVSIRKSRGTEPFSPRPGIVLVRPGRGASCARRSER